METQEQITAQESDKKPKKQKNERFNWWQASLILIGTLAICLSAGYYISERFLWDKNESAKLNERLDYYKEEVNQKPNSPESRVQLGYTYFLKGDDDEAIKQYKTAITLDKKFFDAYLNLSIVYDKQNKTDKALQQAVKATDLSPLDYKGHLMKGKSYRKLKMYKESEEALEEAYRLKAGNVDTLYEIGMVAEAQGDKKEAEAIYKEALSFDPLYKPAIKALDRLSTK
ncbi:tetratricopeptide repeat protein [Mesobacillus zeae]|uniref:Tetratricopeptide repeat protein n=1 Tax=Mesobacillus zeae TaxID=1917180 RepID=A0A398B4A6_9BACI|nr:tetratricopeptide repeat protein [Mesobacillus zeae]RID84879.1 tetratricopeptide repeat protein [Mesobacillus zeae]